MVLTRRISVVVPTYQRPAMLREALASIRALEASHDDLALEIIVGDNGLQDEARRISSEFGAVYTTAAGAGVSCARNAALEAATGDFVAFLDDDDTWLPGHIRPHLAYLDAHPHHDAVFGQAVSTDPELNPLSEPWPRQHPGHGDELTRTLLSGLFPQIGTVVVRKPAVEGVGYFDTRLIGGEDLDWLLRFARRNKLGYVPTPCIHFRGRPVGSSDALQSLRIGFDCRVFLRHALPLAHRLWRSPLGFLISYHGSLIHYHQYFTRKAIWFAEQGSWLGAVRSLKMLWIYLPLLLAADLLRPTPLRRAITRMFFNPRNGSS